MKYLFVSLALFLSLYSQGQDLNKEINKIKPFIQALTDFSENIPQEKVYLHFDNTSYYPGDNIWFKCYVVTSGLNQLSPLSKTLYVELLNPGGEIIDKRILKIEDGQSHGDFTLNHLPFYSGFYEVRAYTKYMLNFGEDLYFSRLLPVFNKPKAEGNYEEKKMLRFGSYGPVGNYPMKRPRPEKGKEVNLRFFPEGGNMIQSVPSRVAFEATDEAGNPIDVAGIVRDDTKQELCRFATLHEGRGVFTAVPVDSNRKAIAEVEYSGKKYRFDLPAGLPQGVVMETDNRSHPDSIGIILRKNGNTPAGALGLVVLTGGTLQSYSYINMTDDRKEISFQIDKTVFPSGVSQIVLFNGKGEMLCDRLIFIGGDDFLDVKAKTDKQSYKPNESVEMEFSVTDKDANPVNAAFSLSIRDGANEVEYGQNILTDLLLMSEIKGYVRSPSWYFEIDDDERRTALDVLLMVQGWRRYAWKRMIEPEAFEFNYPAEQGIETAGKIVSFVRQIPQPKVNVDLLLQQKREEDEETPVFIDSFVTDEQGRFSFVSDVSGRWSMTLAVTENGKKKDHRILLDRIPSLEPKRYRYTDLQINIAEKDAMKMDGEEISDEFEENRDSFFVTYADSLAQADITEKTHLLPEVTIKAGKNTKEQDIRHNRSTSIAYYDATAELDDIYDRGEYIGDDINQMLVNMNKDFYVAYQKGEEYLMYKEKEVIVVVDYEPVELDTWGLTKYRTVRLQAIKSVYINESTSAKGQYLRIDYGIYPPSILLDDIFSCVVFIETYPEGKIPVEGAKGVRKTWLEGYSPVKAFYSPDYFTSPLESDYRRTLYWNPSVTPDESGIAKINFYNNSSCKNFSISAETITLQGMIGIYRNYY
jgi:hypothetical protein